MPTLRHARRALWWLLYLSGGILAVAQDPSSTDIQAIVALNTALDQSSRAAQPHAALASGVDLLRKRAERVRALLHNHPEAVRGVRLPEATVARWLAADPENARLLEHDVTLTGDLGQAVADDFAGNTATNLLTLHDPSTAEIFALYPGGNVSTAGLLHRPVTASGIQIGTDIALERATPATPHAAVRAVAAGANTSLTCSPAGEQKTAVLVLQMPGNTPAYPAPFGTAAWWQQAITGGSGSSVNALWAEMTRGGTFASADVFGPLTLSQRYSCADFAALRTEALTRAAATIDLSRYTRIVLGFPADSCSYGGLATVGCTAADTLVPHPYSTTWMPIGTTYGSGTPVWASLAHELGHNLGLDHANTLDFGTVALGPIDFQAANPGTISGNGTGGNAAQGAVTAVNTEYGDRFSVMGNPWSAAPGPYSTQHRAGVLGWLGSADFLSVSANGTYPLLPASAGSGVRALRVLRDAASSSWLWLEYRDGGTPLDGENLAAVAGAAAPRGVTVRYENGYGEENKTFLLDMAASGAGLNDFATGALLPGQSWSDLYSSLTLTVDSVSAAGAGVTVRYDAPCAAFSPFSGSVSANGGSGSVQVTAPAGCGWSASSNVAWLTLGGTVSGSGNGVFTWTAAPNPGTSQRITYITVGRVGRRLVQAGTNASTFALTPANATVAPGASVTLSLSLAAPGGLSSLQTATLDTTAPGQPPCSVTAVLRGGAMALYLFDDSLQQYTSAVAAGSRATAHTAGCTLLGQGSGVTSGNDTLTLSLNLMFPAAGVRSLFAAANGGTALPVGLLTVAAPSAGSGTVRQSAALALVAPTTLLAGAPLQATVRVAASASGTVPTGAVVLQENGSAIATAPLQGGVAAFTVPGLSAGSHTLTAVYAGDANFAGGSVAAMLTITDFSLTAPGGSGDLVVRTGANSGSTASLTAAGTANGGFPFALALTCEGAPVGTTCTVTPGSGTPGAAALPVTVTVTMAAPPSRAGLWWMALPLAGLCGARRRIGPLLLLVGVCGALGGCGSGLHGVPGSGDATAESSTLTVRAIATDGGVTLSHTVLLSLRVE